MFKSALTTPSICVTARVINQPQAAQVRPSIQSIAERPSASRRVSESRSAGSSYPRHSPASSAGFDAGAVRNR